MENSIDPIYVEIGKRVFDARTRKGFTQEQLANQINLKRTSITNIEKGRQQLLVHMLIKIADALDTNIDQLIPRNKTKKSNQLDNENYPKEAINWVKSALSKA